jgi:membrane-bound lytic murein transglycosylase A
MAELLDTNRSYVFFHEAAAVGAAGVSLTPQKSLAVDPAFHPLNVPLFVSVDAAEAGRAGLAFPFRHLMIAEDRGGAIKGIVRGDIFWGAGVDAAQNAGVMQNRGRLFALLPLTLVPQ